MEIRNARIESTMLGIEDHGIPTCVLKLDYGGLLQNFGGYDLRHYGVTMITGILNAVGAPSWEDLIGEHVRVKCDQGKVYAIGHIIEDKWYQPEKE